MMTAGWHPPVPKWVLSATQRKRGNNHENTEEINCKFQQDIRLQRAAKEKKQL